ncbi:MAG: hypothetical protein KIT43_11115 [Bauldia sp.]|nr:hypothetical protein [Bauldia sp.]
MTAASRVIIHIGLHKTGSTAIQHYFWRHSRALMQHGIYYPATGRPSSTVTQFGHHEVPWSFTPEASEPPQSLLGRLRAEIEETTLGDVVLSSEEFSRMTPAAIAQLAEALPFDTRVIFYYRRQSEIVQGLYGTDVLHGRERRSLDAYARDFKGPLDYGRVASDWGAVYGLAAVTARHYQPHAFPDRNIVPHFLQTMGLTGPSGEGEEFFYNVSMPWFAVLTVLRLRNARVSEATIAEVVASFEIIFRNQRSKLGLFSPAEANAFDQGFAEANAAFSATYAPHEPPLAPHPVEGEDEYRDARRGERPEVELTLQLAARHVRVVHETGLPPAGGTMQ